MRNFPSFIPDETGSQIVEFGLVILPLMGFIFLIMDVAWICFAQASLQHAVQAGVRAAITSYVPTTKDPNGNVQFLPQDQYIKSVVQTNAMGFLAGSDGLNRITISYYSPSNLSNALTGAGSNGGGNVVSVAVSKVPVSSFGPIWREGLASVSLGASSSDVMESSPNGVPPAR